MNEFIDFLIHTDRYLLDWVSLYGPYIYLLLFLIIFSETGFVVTPFLPGDGLLFTVGVIAGTGALNVWLAMALMMVAAISGNTVNYHIGRYFSKTILEGGKIRFVNQEHIDRTHEFFEKHGQKAVILSRFLPVFRTFVPFVAGISYMSRPKFINYTIIGGVTWVLSFSLLGYFFGRIEWVKDNLSTIVISLIIVTAIPFLVTAFKKMPKKRTSNEPASK
jgi:membrane-associated protein